MPVDREAFLRRFQKVFGERSVVLGKELTDSTGGCGYIPTGVRMLDDYVIGKGGIPRGKITEIFGRQSTGKSYLAYRLLANAQALGDVALLDAERAYSPEWGAEVGIDNERLFVTQPITAEEGWSQVMEFVDAGFVLVVIDSIARLVPQAVQEAVDQRKTPRIGESARINRAFLGTLLTGSKAHRSLSDACTALVLLNHETTNISAQPWESSISKTGGSAVDYDTHLCFRIRTKGWEKTKDGSVIRQRVRITCLKNRLGPPLRWADVWLSLDGNLFDDWESVVDTLVETGKIVRKGAYYEVQDKRFQGKASVVEFLQTSEGHKFLDLVLTPTAED